MNPELRKLEVFEAEKKHIAVTTDGTALQYKIHRSADGSHDTIQFRVKENGYGEISVLCDAQGSQPIPREPTIGEIQDFGLMATNALRHEQLTLQLCQYIAGIGRDLYSIYDENARILSFSASLTTSLNTGKE